LLRRIALFLALALLVVVALAGFGLGWSHAEIRSIDPELPNAERVVRVEADAEIPVRLSYVNTASQRMPRSAVLDADRDPRPDAPYVMAHPSFVLAWPDGRLLLLDVGMDRDSAVGFGSRIETFAGGDPIEPLETLADRLGDDVQRIAAIAFTHLHADHTAGLAALCERTTRELRIVQTPLQVDRGNYTTRAGRGQLAEARCARRETLDGGPLHAIPGLPGVGAIAVGGHTPGSQIFVAHVRSGRDVETWVFTGDVVNQIDGVRLNLSKPYLYSLLVVPEAPARLERLRGYLADLESQHGARLLVSHDQLAIESSGIPVH
jgi:glyoxylase-like metal-dependent hydrolase (beta-lactamase superfamily II)